MAGPVLVVSPHLDDAVLSLGGTIAARAARGQRVVIASVYTKGPPLAEIAPAMRKFADYTARCIEDDAACRVIGAEVRRLDQIERAFRRPYLTGWSFFSTPVDRAGFSGLAGVATALGALAPLDPVEIFVPLGIGNHVDHVEALIAATDWAIGRSWRDRLRFYEDFYALSRSIRNRHFVTRRAGQARISPLLRARRLAVILRTISTRIAGPPVETFLERSIADAHWVSRGEPLREHEATKLAAIACYTSQMKAFGGLSGIDRALRAYHRQFGHAEPYWIAR